MSNTPLILPMIPLEPAYHRDGVDPSDTTDFINAARLPTPSGDHPPDEHAQHPPATVGFAAERVVSIKPEALASTPALAVANAPRRRFGST